MCKWSKPARLDIFWGRLLRRKTSLGGGEKMKDQEKRKKRGFPLKTFTLTTVTSAKLVALATKLKVTQSEVVRMALDKLADFHGIQ